MDTKRYVVTNKAKGGRMILTPTGGTTIFAGESRTFELTEKDLEAARPYIDNGDLQVREATKDDAAPEGAPLTSLNPTASSDGAKGVSTDGGEAPVDPADVPVDENDADVTHVEHRGFGRWFGMKGDEAVTEAMTKAEAEAFAAEHKVPLGKEPDPAAEDEVETPAEEPASPPDETETEQ